jgi:hypothetical protein
MDLSNVAEQLVVVLVSFTLSAVKPAVKTAARHSYISLVSISSK